MMKTRRNCIAGFLAILMMVVTLSFSAPAYAEEIDSAIPTSTPTTNSIVPYDGSNEVLPLGEYVIGNFTFTNTNLTPVKISTGRYLKLGITFRKASTDEGLGNVKLRVNVRDASTGEVISKTFEWNASTNPSTYTIVQTDDIDLGYSNRKIQIWFDASSTGTSNGKYRSIQVHPYNSYTHN